MMKPRPYTSYFTFYALRHTDYGDVFMMKPQIHTSRLTLYVLRFTNYGDDIMNLAFAYFVA